MVCCLCSGVWVNVSDELVGLMNTDRSSLRLWDSETLPGVCWMISNSWSDCNGADFLFWSKDLTWSSSTVSVDWFSPTFSVSAPHEQTEDVSGPVGVHRWGWWTGPLTSVNIHLQCDKVGAVRWKDSGPTHLYNYSLRWITAGSDITEGERGGTVGDGQSWWHWHHVH